jgi:hypothetical protein
MRFRKMAVTAVSVAAAAAGVAAVQSGIPGTGALPVVRHAGEPSAPEGPGLPAPGEPAVAPPSVGAVREAPAATTVVRVGTSPAGRPRVSTQRSQADGKSGSDGKDKTSDKSGDGKGKSGEDGSGKAKSGKDGSGKDD